MNEYLAECRKRHGGPHVWNPDVEIVESLSRYTRRDPELPDMKEILEPVADCADELLNDIQSLVDRSAFSGPRGRQLCALCAAALTQVGPLARPEISFWELMCLTCD